LTPAAVKGSVNRNTSVIQGGGCVLQGRRSYPVGRGGSGNVARIERIGGNYEVEELEFGLVYRWRPERFVVECDCGERMVTSGPEFVCGCGTDHGPAVRECRLEGRPTNEALHPWRFVREREGVGLP
jgi:hypothetical protein